MQALPQLLIPSLEEVFVYIRKIFVVLVCLVLILCSCQKGEKVNKETAVKSGKITFLHFNDLHGYIAPRSSADGKIGGIARIKTLIDQITEKNRAKNIDTLVFFAGDFLQGSVFSTVSHGKMTLSALNKLPVSIMTVGNHEMDFGPENFDLMVKTANFPMVVSNVRMESKTTPILEPYKILTTMNGLKIGVIGVTTDELLTTTNPLNVKGLAVDNASKSVTKYLAAAKAKSDMLVVLSHCGVTCDKQIAMDNPGIDLIIGGHNHEKFLEPIISNNTPIVQAGSYGAYLGRADMVFENGKASLSHYQIYPITEKIQEQADLKTIVAIFKSKVSSKTKELIGETSTLLDGENATIRRTESNLANFVCDSIKERFGVDAVLLNGGGFRSSIQKGQITMGNVLEVFPFGNTLVKVMIKGKVIREVIEIGLEKNPEDNPGSFIQVSGMAYKIKGKKAVEITLGGVPLDEEKTYSVIVNSFIALGGDMFFMFKDITEKADTGYTLSEVFIQAIRDSKSIAPKTDGRITRVAPWKP